MSSSSKPAPLDGVAIAISGLCALHCLLLPVLLSLSPALVDPLFGDEHFHGWLLVLIVPVSALALGSGYRRHRDAAIWPPAFAGLVLLLISAIAGIEVLGPLWEPVITVSGGVLMAWAHWLNFRCRQLARTEAAH